MSLIYPLIGFFLFVSCSSLTKTEYFNNNKKNYREFSKDDYIKHFDLLAKDYLKNEEVNQVKLSKSSKQYLQSTYYQIVNNNELLLKDSLKLKFYIVNSPRIFYFSLPGGHIFFSQQLIQKYLEHEALFISLFCYEVIRTHRNIYQKKIVIPTGFINTERLIYLTRLDVDTRVDVGKWTYHSVNRSGFDGQAYLNWLQIQNKHSLDFVLMFGNSGEVSREEFLFKNFLVKNRDSLIKRDVIALSSTRKYYKLRKEIARQSK